VALSCKWQVTALFTLPSLRAKFKDRLAGKMVSAAMRKSMVNGLKVA
jgi:hypothetical protein